MHEVTAPSKFSPGEDICIFEPFIELLSREFKDVACESCFKRDPNLISCKACSDVKYCSRECLEKNWKYHILECQKLKNLPLDHGTVEADFIRLTGNTILKIKGEDWKTVKRNILGTGVSFDDIETSVNISDTYRHIFYSPRKDYIRRYIGDENMPNDEDFKQILGKVRNSIYHAPIPALRVATIRFIFELSFFPTECIPNCRFVARKDVNKIKTIKKIEKSEKLSLSRKTLFGALDEPGITSRCNCTDCRLPYGESILSKITDEHKALDVIVATQHFINTWYIYGFALKLSELQFLVDDLLQKHEGILGNTNILHLKLLAIKCFYIEDPPLEAKRNLLKLEKNIVAAFGEYDPHLVKVYNALAKTCFSMGNYAEGDRYVEKAMNVS